MPNESIKNKSRRPWVEDPTPVKIITTRSRIEAFLRFIAHEHIPYEAYGRELNIFVGDVEDGYAGRQIGNEPRVETGVFGAGTESFRTDPHDHTKPTHRGGPYDSRPGGRFAEFKRTGIDPGPEFNTIKLKTVTSAPTTSS